MLWVQSGTLIWQLGTSPVRDRRSSLILVLRYKLSQFVSQLQSQFVSQLQSQFVSQLQADDLYGAVRRCVSVQQFPYVEGYDAFNIYPDAAPYSEPPPEGYTPPTQYALLVAQNDEFYGECAPQHHSLFQGLLTQ